MTALLLLFCQSLGPSLSEEWPVGFEREELRLEDLPRLGETGQQEEPRHGLEEMIAVEAFAVYTRFDPGLRIDNDWGYGGNFKVLWNSGRAASLVVQMGYAGWNTRNDESQTFPGTSEVRQYRLGVGGEFAGRHFEFGIYTNLGLYHFHTRHVSDDTAWFFELEAAFRFKPTPFLSVGLLGMLTFTNSDYNRGTGRTHFSVNESIGPAVEFKIEF